MPGTVVKFCKFCLILSSETMLMIENNVLICGLPKLSNATVVKILFGWIFNIVFQTSSYLQVI